MGSEGLVGEAVGIGAGVGSVGFVGDGISVDFGDSNGLGLTVGATEGLTEGATEGVASGETVGIGDIFGDSTGDGLIGGVTVGDNFNLVSGCGESAAANIPDNKNKPATKIKIVFLYIKISLSFFLPSQHTNLCNDLQQKYLFKNIKGNDYAVWD